MITLEKLFLQFSPAKYFTSIMYSYMFKGGVSSRVSLRGRGRGRGRGQAQGQQAGVAMAQGTTGLAQRRWRGGRAGSCSLK